MKKITATLIAGLFATTAFAQVPDSPVAKTNVETKDAKTAVLVDTKEARADLKATTKEAQKAATTDAKAKVVAKTDTKDAKAAVKADAKDAKAELKADAKVGTEAHPENHGAHVSATAQTK